MALHFLLEDRDLSTAATGDVVTFGGAEAHHAATVRRVRPGEEVTLGEGSGSWVEAVVETASAREVSVRVRSVRHEERPAPRVTLVQALAKGDRDELAVQAATELGVDRIIPWQAARSVSRWEAAKRDRGVARWQSIVREAAKQAHRAWVPRVEAPLSTVELLSLAPAALVLEPTAQTALSAWGPAAAEDIVLVVGPEGGIAPDELQRLDEAGATLVRLGSTILRTSTAGPAALALLNGRLGRW